MRRAEETVMQELIQAIEKGKGKQVKWLIEQAVEDGYSPQEIVDTGLVPAMEQVAGKYRSKQFFVPEVILAAHAMTVGTTILGELMEGWNQETVGTVVIGTVKGDLHDIGKNLVIMMLRGVGFAVHDLGYDVEVDTFIEKAEECRADIICMSAMLTTTMPEMRKVVGKLVNKRLRDKYIIMVGGAPVTEAFARNIGADIYTKDAGGAAQIAKAAVLSRREKETEHL